MNVSRALPLLRIALGFAAGGAVMASASASAQSTCQVPFEAYLADSDGVPVDDTLDVTLRFYSAATGGEAIDCRSFPDTTIRQGWVRVTLDECDGPPAVGDCGVLTLDDIIEAVEDAAGTTYLTVQIGDEPEMSPRIAVGAAPTAYEANRARICEELEGFDDTLDAALMSMATLESLSCELGQVPQYNGFEWECAAERLLTEAEVDFYVEDNGYVTEEALAAVATSGSFADLVDIPAGLEDGDTEYEAGLGILIEGTTISVDRDLIESWIGGTEALPECDGPGQVMSWDGSRWACSDAWARLPEATCTPGQCLTYALGELTCTPCGGEGGGSGGGVANGFAITDAWGYVWDGIQRPTRTWEEANTICEGLGGRLPTVTELHHNNANTGIGSIAGTEATSYLWTAIASHNSGQHVSVRLSDGNISYTADTSRLAFRCVWPDFESEAFDGDYCNGDPGAGCTTLDGWWNVDQFDRPPLTWTAAVNECNYYNASIPRTSEFARLVQSGWTNGSNNWLWMGDAKYWYNNNWGLAIGRWTGDGDDRWGWDNGTHGALSTATSSRAFRCIGLRDEGFGVAPDAPACSGDECFTYETRRSRIWADSADRTAANFSAAAEVCRMAGARLPNIVDFTELVAHGWTGGTNAWLWLADPAYRYSGTYGYFTTRWTGDGNPYWRPDSSSMTVQNSTSSVAYRCVWTETYEDTPTACAADEVQVWDGDAFDCETSVDGDSDGEGNPGGLQLVDDWGNAWDLFARPTSSWADATATCESIGGRLPTPTEVYRVRANQEDNDSIGDVSSTAYIWTLAPDPRTDQRVTIRVSDGGVSNSAESSALPYRCVWPSTETEVFTGRACAGPAESPCFTAGRARLDQRDRAPVPLSAANWECSYFGGRLADADDFMRFTHAGAPNGTNNWLWLNNPIYRYSNQYNYAIGRWTGTGTTGWQYQSGPFGTDAPETNRYHFRCVYDDDLR